jgi:hypothetical protein
MKIIPKAWEMDDRKNNEKWKVSIYTFSSIN